jgi:hypothetical protein
VGVIGTIVVEYNVGILEVRVKEVGKFVVTLAELLEFVD